MNLKNQLKVATIAGSAALTTAMLATSAQAFVISGMPAYTNSGSLPTVLSVTEEGVTGTIPSEFTDVSNLLVNELNLASGGLGGLFNAEYGNTPSYITNFTYQGIAAAINLSGSNQVVHLVAPTGGVFTIDFDFTGKIVNQANPSQVLAHVMGSLSSVANTTGGGNFSIDLDATPIPTPALLPGLIGMGVAALRKKQGQEEGSEAS